MNPSTRIGNKNWQSTLPSAPQFDAFHADLFITIVQLYALKDTENFSVTNLLKHEINTN
jgi:hypothetical protein